MSTPLDRWAQGPQGGQTSNYDNWDQMVGAAPHDDVRSTVTNAVRQMDPQEYYDHTQPGVGGTNPLGNLAQPQRTGLAQTLLNALLGMGLGQQTISQGAGIQTLDPSRMSPQDLAALAQWTQRNHPEALGQVAAENRDNPGLIESLLGNKALMMLVAGLGAKYLSDRANQQRQQNGGSYRK